jgi:hypothetical protein
MDTMLQREDLMNKIIALMTVLAFMTATVFAEPIVIASEVLPSIYPK